MFRFNFSPGLFFRVHKLLVILTALFIGSKNLSAQLIINEVSQGPSGTKEWVELLVTGTPNCSGIPTVDLRGWYIDDNNGTFACCTSVGLAPGCVRFTTDALWSAVPAGTIIVLYNDGDLDPAIPAQDLSLTDGNCRLIVPVSNCALIEKNTAQPNSSNITFPSSGFTACGQWSILGMNNSDDSFQTRDPLGNLIHAVSWGSNTSNTIIYFPGAAGGMSIWMNNATNNNPALQSNWTRTSVASETPGVANSPANAGWIASMNNNCSPIIALTATGSATNTCSCTGTATATPSGGMTPYSYSWAPSGGTNATATSLCPGPYTCTITDAAGCTQTVMVTVGALPSPTVSILLQSDVSCNGANDGSATVNVTGGSGAYSYSWSPSGGTNATATGLDDGTYIITVTDSAGCSGNISVVISEPLILAVTATQTNVSCNGGTDGSATVTPSGGTGPYTYSWTPSGGNGSTASNLGAGVYTATITDDNNCTITQTFNITQPGPLTASAGNGGTICAGDSIALNGTAGGAFTSVLWQGGTGSFNPATSLSTTYTSGAGDNGTITLTLTVSDACGNTVTSTVNITVNPVPAAQLVAGGPLSLCAGDSVSLTASGGATFLWSTGATTSSIFASAAGIYSVIVSNSCGSDTTFVTITNTTAPVAQVTASGPTTFCAGDSVTLTVSGGGAYLWSTGSTAASITVNAAGTFSVTASASCGSDTAYQSITVNPFPVAVITAGGPVTFCQGDSVTLTAAGGNSFLWSTSSTTNTITVNTTGTYSVVVSNACGSDTAQQVVSVFPFPSVTITASGPTTFCSDDNVTLTATGGTSYLWSNSSTSASITVGTAGTYTVAVTNACGTDTAQQTVTVLPLPNAVMSASGPTSFCAGDNVTLTASGGTTYLWSTGSTSQAITVSTSGTYSVIVTNSCGGDTATIVTNVIPLPVAQVSGGTVLCPGDQAVLTATGGINYLWSNGDTGSAITVNTAGTYSVVASNGCGSDTAIVVVTASSVLAGFSASTDSGGVPLPVDFTDNSINATSWLWDFGNGNNSSATDPTEIYQTPGVYTVILIVTNSDGCTDSASMLITVTDVPVVITIPNVFTPNGDGTNDVFLISSEGLSEMNLEIFDRWGVLMTEIQSPLMGWDGRTTSGMEATDGTYYYVLSATGYNGKAYSEKGFFQLIR